MYKLFTDKTELFECSISLQGASLKKSKARLVIETPEDASKKVTVEVKTQTSKKSIVETKVNVKVKDSKPTITEKEHIMSLFKLLIKEDINVDNISFKRNELNNIVATYLKENTVKNTSKVINGVLKVLEKKK